MDTRTEIQRMYAFAVGTEDGGVFKQHLESILNQHHETAYPLMETPDSKRFLVRVTDERDRLVGGAIIWTYWDWLDLSLLALEHEAPGYGVGRQLMDTIEAKAREEDCTRIRVETFEHEVGFYQSLGYRIVGHLEDYPQGYSYYWLRKDLAAAE